MVDTPLDVLLLGSGGWYPTERRETACALVRSGDRALLLDAGSGVRRLVERPALLGAARRLDIVLTHFHLDHVSGLPCLPALDDAIERHIWGPGALNYDETTERICGRLLGAPFFGGLGAVAQVHDIPRGPFEVAGLAVAHRTQHRHPAPTLALRIGDELAWCTDTAADPETARFARGVRVLAHEAWSTSAAPRDTAGHTTARDAAAFARAAEADHLTLIHVNPQGDDAALEADGQGPVPVTIGQDLAPLRPTDGAGADAVGLH